ncbi:NEDD8-conjugating enzyme UBC12 [Fusarium oxysporum f. sp. albedinis]|nr:NEDD8-conjugating enzyme UBC12 [Fusarium oxysporum f. sp. albedinis]
MISPVLYSEGKRSVYNATLGGGLQACFLTLSRLVQPDSPVLSEPAPHLELSPAEDATVIRETRPDNDTKVVPACPRCHILRLALFRLGLIA